MLAGSTAPILFALLASTFACAHPPRSGMTPTPVAAGAPEPIPQAESATIGLPTPADSKPVRATHMVEAGETITSIAPRYGITIGDLARANPELNPDRIRAGQSILLPEHAWREPLPRDAPQRESAPDLRHRVEAGENLYRIGVRYQVTVAEIAEANGLADPFVVYPGQELRIPDARRRVTADEAVPAPITAPAPQPLEAVFRALDETEVALREARFEESLGAVRRANVELEEVLALRAADSESQAAAVRSAMLEGTSHAGLGDEEAAIQSFARILALDPNYTPDRERTSPKIRQLFEAARSAAPSEPVAEPVAPPPASSSSTPR